MPPADSSPRRRTLLQEDRLAGLLRQAKIRALQGRRLLRWLGEPDSFPAPQLSTAAADFPFLLYERRLPIARRDAAAHPVFEDGKRKNLALAAPAFDGLLLSPERPLSFWRTLGRVTAAAGFRAGMELHGGCIVPALGGGLCLLSNMIFRLAVDLGWDILERHGHTLEAVPPAPGEIWGLDATVFWPYVDLRVAPRSGQAWLRARAAGDTLRLSAHADRPADVRVELEAGPITEETTPAGRFRAGSVRRRLFDLRSGALLADHVVAESRKQVLHDQELHRNCLTCGETSCHARGRYLSVVQ